MDKSAEIITSTEGITLNHAAIEKVAENEPVIESYAEPPAVVKVEKAAPEARILKAEDKQSGSIENSVYIKYARAMGGYLPLGITMVFLTFVNMAALDLWLVEWIDHKESNDDKYPKLYGILTAVFVLLQLTSSLVLCVGGAEASKTLHFDTLSRVLRAPMGWFEEAPMGRILSRFSSDLNKVDFHLPLMCDNLLQISSSLFVIIAVVVYLVPVSAVFAFFLLIFYVILIYAVNRSVREMKRVSNNALAPVMSNIGEIETGVSLIRVMDCRAFFEERHHDYVNEVTKSNYCAGSLLNLGSFIAAVCAFVIATAAASSLWFKAGNYTTSRMALAVTYAMLVPYFLGFLTGMFSLTFMLFASLERLLEYSDLPQEASAPKEMPPIPEEWPRKGAIAFENVTLRYHESLPPSLSDVSFEVKPGEKIGIVGRTGAGKSSLVTALFRLVETEGVVSIDGQDTSKMGLKQLRTALAIIPQEPILMNGSVQLNVDPFSQYSVSEVTEALSQARLSHLSLDDQVAKAGANLSAGERQLLCFARVLLMKRSIVVLDEPTSNVDAETDATIQWMTRKAFKNTAVLCIAHRLFTIIDYDRILVMDQGKVVEYGSADELLANPQGYFSGMVDAMGTEAGRELRKLAAKKAQETAM